MPHSIETIASTRKKTKETIRVESLIPMELREKSAALIELLRDYYTHLNEKDQSSYVLNSINNQRDIDLAESRIGKIDRIGIINGGSGYSNNPVVTIQGDGTGAAATATVRNGVITALILTSAGLGYTYATVTITDSTGTDAVAQAVVSSLSYLDLIQKEIAISVPKNLTLDRVTLYKNLIRYYSLRGSQESIELFFKILYNDNVELYYPKDSMLIPSSGTWDPAFKSSFSISTLDQTLHDTFQIQLTPGSTGTADYAINEKIIGLTSDAETFVRAVDGNTITVSGILTGNDQFQRGETVVGETTVEVENYIASEPVEGDISSATGTVDTVVDDATVDIIPLTGTFQVGETLQAIGSSGSSGTQRKIDSIEKIFTIPLNTFGSSDGIQGTNSGAVGTITAISTNVLDVTYDSVDSRNAPTPAFFQAGETVFATTGLTANIRPIASINNKITFDVTDASGFAVDDVVSGANSGARGTIESISTNTIVVTGATGAFRDGENVVNDLDPAGVYSDITNTPITHAFLTLGTFEVGDVVSNGSEYATVIEASDTSITVGYSSGTFSTGDTLTGGSGTIIQRKATGTVVEKLRMIVTNFVVGEPISNGTANGTVTYVSENTVRIQNITGGTFSIGDDLSGDSSNIVRRASSVTPGVERDIAAIYKDGQLMLKVDISAPTGDFTIGETVTGLTSGEFAKIIGYSDGVLTVTNPSGVFTRGETIEGSVSLETATVVRSYTEGYYTSNLGFLDDTIKLQDSYFYQKFSYVIRTGNNVDIWRDSFNRLVHPSGFKFFGEILLLIELLGLKSSISRLQPGMIYDEDIPLLILIDALQTLESGNQLLNTANAVLAATVYQMALDVPTGTDGAEMMKFFDDNPINIYRAMTIQQADGFSQETPVGSAYAWDDYTIDDVINNEVTWNDVILGANLI